MTLLISNEDAQVLLDMRDCVSILDQTYAAAHAGSAINGRRSDMVGPGVGPDRAYVLKMMGAIQPDLNVGAIRINSDIFSWESDGAQRRRVKIPAAPGNRWVGLVLLFSMATGEPLAIFPDGVVQRMRVGATSGIAVQRLARLDATELAILGTGWQAEAQVLAAAAVRPLREIRCFSPNAERCAAFAARMESQLDIPSRATATPEAAVLGADIVLCATNSSSHVLHEDWLAPGMHIGSIRDREIAPAAIARADLVVVHDRDNLTGQHVEIAQGAVFEEKRKELGQDPRTSRLVAAPSLAELVGGDVPGRRSADDITCFLNYHGIGLQFAALGALLHRKAVEKGRGHHLPTEWFTEDVHP
ncbi:MAG: ornithine cyclodeaminase family protein [Rhodospirillaceae bacterium]|nr:ornithine cyclodeaminase family protein [Rhodospirillaceae bacterium]